MQAAQSYNDATVSNNPPRHEAGGEKSFFSVWANSNIIASLSLLIAGGIAFTSTWFLMSPAVETTDRNILIILIVTNVMIAAAFALLVGHQLWQVWFERRHQLAGSRTHLQLVWAFAIAAIVPAFVAFLFAFTILRSSMDDVFSGRIEEYHETARETANLLVDHIATVMLQDMQNTENDIYTQELYNIGFERTPIGFREYLRTVQMPARGLQALYILDKDRNVILRIENAPANYVLPPTSTLDEIDATYDAEVASNGVASGFRFTMNNIPAIDMWKGVQKMRSFGGGYLVFYKPIPQGTREQLQFVRAMAADWAEAERGRRRLERVFVGGYIILGTIILFGSIWAALGAANRIVGPIGRLVGMADRVSGGDLQARVEVKRTDGELGELAKSMNRMTSQLQNQRNDLIETNHQVDRRRQFTEAVLSGVSAGVLGVNKDATLTIINRSAADLLKIDNNDVTGKPLNDIAPELIELFDKATTSLAIEVGEAIEFNRDGHSQIFNVRIVRDKGSSTGSYVITFDNITQLISAQRDAAWGDVARRIAHEIKNPLTPIQLSAERLRRKYLSEVTTDPEIFDKCTDTIIRQVNDIGRMVDEFSSFARMPTPVIVTEDLRDLIKSAVFPQRVAFSDINFEVDLPDEPMNVACDGRLIVQALSNIIKNAGESITARIASEKQNDLSNDDKVDTVLDKGEDVPGRILVRGNIYNGKGCIDVIDNGIGLPNTERHRLVEPYMTTRQKGTGLGLAIVKKVVEEHGGNLSFTDDCSLGACGARMMISLPIVKIKNDSDEKIVSKTMMKAVTMNEN